MSKRFVVGAVVACVASAACGTDTATSPTPPVSTGRPRSQAPALNFPSGLYRLTLRSSSRSFGPLGVAPCQPELAAPTDKVVQTDLQLVPEDGVFTGRATGAGDTLVVRLRDAGPNYIGSRDVRGTIAGAAGAREGTALAFETMAVLEILVGSGGSENAPESTTASVSFSGPLRFIEAGGGVATCNSATAWLELVSRHTG